ncbi:MAG: 5-dehydro-4-deoxyglucarate dehydratase [Mycobacterium sp.]|nr:5-dehydro-4-deoxyglucarate dehydratase [Mycobacterium sp.]
MLDGVLFFPVTPFTVSGEVDLTKLAAHVAKGVDAGPGGVFIACGTGEFHALELREMVTSVQQGLLNGELDLGMARPPVKRPGLFRERPVELDAVWRGDSTNPALLRLLRDVLPQREWTADGLVEEAVG